MTDREALKALKGLTGYTADIVWSPLYDYQRVKIDETLDFHREFFQFPIGLACPTGLRGDEARTLEETNLYHPGTLPRGNEFYATAIKVWIVPGWDRAGSWTKEDERDFDTLTSQGHLELRVQNRIWAQFAPLASMPAGFVTPSRLLKPRLSPDQENFLTPFLEILKEVKECVPKIQEITPVYIQSQMGFSVHVSFAQALKIESDALMGVILDGYLVRNPI
jgi:hypothetical protein